MEVLNLEVTKENFLENFPFFLEIADLFVDEYQENSAELDEAVRNLDNLKIREICHKLIGPIGNLGGEKALRALYAFHEAVKKQPSNGYISEYEVFTDEIEKLKEALADIKERGIW